MKTTDKVKVEAKKKNGLDRLGSLYNTASKTRTSAGAKLMTTSKTANGNKDKAAAKAVSEKAASGVKSASAVKKKSSAKKAGRPANSAAVRKAPAKKNPAPAWDLDSFFAPKMKREKTDSIKKSVEEMNTEKIFGTELSFAAREAYKLLRTNLMFSLPSTEGGCGHIIGMTSALRGEGKSTTTINLSRVLAEQGKKVIVVEGDLRLPSLRKKLNIEVETGLSHVLISRANPLDYVRSINVGKVDDKQIYVDMLMAGTIPPNPSELLGSKRMEEVLHTLAQKYDFVLLDLPPVTAVSDALVATKLVDGVVLVVRNLHCNTGSLNDAIRQLRQVEGKILGFVFTCANSNRGAYRKKYGGRYSRYYRYSYYDSDYEYGS